MTPGNEHAILSQPAARGRVGLEVWGLQESQVRVQGHLLWGLPLEGWGNPKLRDAVTRGDAGGAPVGFGVCRSQLG